MAIGNPYYVEPLGGLDVGAKLTQVIEGGRQVQRRKEWEDTAAGIIESGDPRAISQLMIKYPEMSGTIKEAMGLSPRSMTTLQGIAQQILVTGEAPPEALMAQIQAAQQSGENPAVAMKMMQQMAAGDIEGLKKTAELYTAMADPKAYESYAKAAGKKEQALVKNAQEAFARQNPDATYEDWLQFEKQVAAAKRDPASGSGGSSKIPADVVKFEMWKNMPEGPEKEAFGNMIGVTGESPEAALKRQEMELRIAELKQKIGSREEEATQAQNVAREKADTLSAGVDSVLTEIDKAIDIAEKSPTATGVLGAATQAIPSTPSKKLRAVVGTIKANIGFDRLQLMRDLSKTGGALGQVAIQELDALQNSIASLDPDIGDEMLLQNLKKVQNHYKRLKELYSAAMNHGNSSTSKPVSEMSDDEILKALGS